MFVNQVINAITNNYIRFIYPSGWGKIYQEAN
jgi:hypothetical protein